MTVAPQDSLTVVWSSEDADTCTGSASITDGSARWIGEQSTEGEIVVGPLTVSTSLTLDCVGPAGNDQQTVVVTVAGSACPPPEAAATVTQKVGGGVLDLLVLTYLSLIALVWRRRKILAERG